MMKPITPDSPPEEIAAFTQMLPKLVSLLNNNDQAKQILNDAQTGKISQAELIQQLSSVLENVDGNID